MLGVLPGMLKRIKKLLTLAKKYIYIGRFGHYCCLLQQR